MNHTLEDIPTELSTQGRYRQALKVLHVKRNSVVKHVGCNSYDSLLIESQIAAVLRKQGRYDEALSTFNDAEKKLSEFPDTFPLKVFRIKLDIGSVFVKKFMYINALRICEDIHKYMRITFGSNHPLTYEARTYIGLVLNKFGRHDEALRILNEIRGYLPSCQGTSQITALNFLSDIAKVYLNQCKYDEAMKVFKVVYEIRKERHPNEWTTLLELCNIATVLESQGRYHAAFQIYCDVYFIQKETKPSYPETLNILQRIAQIFQEKGNNNAALICFKKIYSIHNEECPMHPDTLLVQRHITTILLKQEKYDEAEYFFIIMLRKISVLYGSDSDLSLEVQQNIAFILFDKEKYLQCLQIFNRVYHIQSKRCDLGPDHTDALLTKIHMGGIHRVLYKYKKAIRNFKDVLEKISVQSLHDDLAYITVQNNIAATYAEQGKFDEAFQIFNEMYENQVKNLGFEHSETLKTKTNLDRLNIAAPQSVLVESIIENDFAFVNFSIEILNKDINEQDHKGCTPLHIASEKGHTNIVKFLLYKGAFYNIRNKEGKTPVDVSANDEIKTLFNSIEKLFTAVKKLDGRNVSKIINNNNDDVGTIINARDEDGNTSLHLASLKGYTDIVKFLLNSGADPTARNRAGDILLHTAVKKDFKVIVEILLLHVQRTNTSNSVVNTPSNANSMTPLHIAVLNGNFKIAKMLLDHGANVTAKMKTYIRDRHVE